MTALLPDDDYEHDIEPGAGHTPLPGRRKVIVHTTETGPGSLRAVRDSWRGRDNWGKGLPHFIAEGPKYVQLLPLDTCAYTSLGGPDSANKAGTPIQIEIVHRAADPFSDAELDAFGKWLADLIRAGIDLDLDQCPRFYGAGDGVVLATSNSPVRQIITDTWGSFAQFNGICGHQHLRGNDHWDPGRLDIDRACDIARERLAGKPPQKQQEDDDVTTWFIWEAHPDTTTRFAPGVYLAFSHDRFVSALDPGEVQDLVALAGLFPDGIKYQGKVAGPFWAGKRLLPRHLGDVETLRSTIVGAAPAIDVDALSAAIAAKLDGHDNDEVTAGMIAAAVSDVLDQISAGLDNVPRWTPAG